MISKGQTQFIPDMNQILFVSEAWAAKKDPDKLTWKQLAGDGSDRTFIRVSRQDSTAILIHGPNMAENRSYVAIGRHMWALRLGPEILAVDEKNGLCLVEDLGDFTLQDWVRATDDRGRAPIYHDVIALMVKLHRQGLNGFDPDWCYQTPCYDRELILERETGYFLEAFVKGLMNIPVKIKFFETEFEALAEAALKGSETTLIHRDFQSRNVMIKDGAPRLVDFQGARPGPPAYDLASVLLDPYVNLGPSLKNGLLEFYLETRASEQGFERRAFLDNYVYLGVCRLLQALGAYGFLKGVKGKFLFGKYIPAAVSSLDDLLSSREFDFMPRLRRLVRDIQNKVGVSH